MDIDAKHPVEWNNIEAPRCLGKKRSQHASKHVDGTLDIPT
jgi:hypothetical protein